MIARALAFALVAAGAGASVYFRPDLALGVATSFAAHHVCAETFLLGRDPDEAFDQIVRVQPGINLLAPLMRVSIGRAQASVRVSIPVLLSIQTTYVRGWGCLTSDGGATPSPIDEATTSLGPESEAPLIAGNDALAQALEQGFAPLPDGRARGVEALVVMRDGKIVAERYRAGLGPSSRLYGHSLSKSLTHALIGTLVRDGRLTVDAPPPYEEWRAPGDPRGGIRLEHLLRMTSGLDLDETNSGFDPSSRIVYLSRDTLRAARAGGVIAPPGARWAYSSPSTILAVGAIRQVVGGGPREFRRFVRERLAAPLGMTGLELEFDAAGGWVGSTFSAATARDWARLGQLYLDDGMAGGRRILPAGWADFAANPTPNAPFGYGAGFWTNRGDSFGAQARMKLGFPADSYFASGALDQRIVIVPSERLVIARLGRTAVFPESDIVGTAKLVRDVVEALHK